MSTFSIPIGPQHPALPEPILLKIEVEGEYVVGVDVDISYMHRGIEKAMENRNYIQNIYLAERICGICNVAHTVCYTLNIDKLYEKEIPPRAQYLRVIIEELNRIHSHLLWLGIAGHEIGFETLFMYVWRDRERVMDLIETITGNRVNTAYTTIGGVRRDITSDIEYKIRKTMDIVEERTKYYKNVAAKEPTILTRTRDIGILKTMDAIKLCAVGPLLRASNVKNDVRADAPYAAHDEVPFNVITYPYCDVFSRVLVRVDEIFECINIIRYCLDHLPKGPIRIKLPLKPPKGEAITRVEAPRGELLHYVLSDGSEKPYRYKVRTPTLANIPALCRMLTSSGDYVVKIADIPIAYASIDPCLCCTGRIQFLDIEKNKQWSWTWEELKKYSKKEMENK